MNFRDFKKDKEFINQLLDIRDYWLGVDRCKDNPKELVNGFIHSLLVMFDGDSGMNDFHPISLIDNETEECINEGYPLHEQLYIIEQERKK